MLAGVDLLAVPDLAKIGDIAEELAEGVPRPAARGRAEPEVVGDHSWAVLVYDFEPSTRCYTDPTNLRRCAAGTE
jgi:hypothetical protein